MTSPLKVTSSRAQARWKPRDVWCAAAGFVSLALAVGAASMVAVPVDSDVGLVGVLPLPYWAGVLILNVAFVVALRGDAAGPARSPVMLWLVAVQVLVLFGTAAFVTDVPRGEVAFRHLGIADALSGNTGVDPNIDAYFNWPGFFALLATVLRATGMDPVTVALWAPVFNVGLWLAAVAVVTRSLTRDPRRLWLVLWLFCLGNWQDQDYLSPQAFGFFLYLVVIALAVGPLAAKTPAFPGFRRTDLTAWWRGRVPVDPRPGHRVSALVITLLLIVVISASHQLTPFMVLIALTALTLAGRLWPGRLPLVAGIVLVLWLAYPASTYLAGHPPLADAGLQTAIEANVVDRTNGTAGHILVVQVRIALTVLLWALAGAGMIRDWRRRRLDIRVVLLAVTPLLLFPAQAYGGEMLIRISLFALPFIALQACSVLLPADRIARPPLRAAGALALIFVLFAGMTVTGRFGNAQYDVFADDEIDAVGTVGRLAPPGAAIISAAHPTPWRSQDYLGHRYRTIEDLCPSDLTAGTCGPLIYAYARHNNSGAYLLLLRSSESSLVAQGQTTTQGFDELENWLKAHDGVNLVFNNDDARIYKVGP
ncbi:glycosyltransferase [Pseudarthrobacter phenanthrenivorans]|uniref:glycosyltransferase n=1 Tax=Pseudarthrobacter phenanthrenivorans TaxID=361575 RepID=UPI00344F483F